MVDFGGKEVYSNKILGAILLLMLLSLSLLYLSPSKNNKVSNFSDGENSIILVDLTNKVERPDYQFILGVSTLVFAAGLLIYFLFFNRRKKDTESNLVAKLSKKEKEVLPFVIQNMSNKEIAGALFISPNTVKTHINNIFKKLNVKSRAELKDFL